MDKKLNDYQVALRISFPHHVALAALSSEVHVDLSALKSR